MARFCNLFSGSSGNCTYISTGFGGILIDAGVSARRIEQALKERDIAPDSIEAIFVTHEHVDHVTGVRVFGYKHGCRIFGSVGTLEAMTQAGALGPQNEVQVMPDSVAAADMRVTAFHTSHDSAESLGFMVEMPTGRRVAVISDTGVLTPETLQAARGCDLVQIESNHDPIMLQYGRYPFPLKERIRSAIGHLSNPDCAAALPSLAESGTTRFVLSHLSRENNTPDRARQTAVQALTASGMTAGVDYLLSVSEPISHEKWMVL